MTTRLPRYYTPPGIELPAHCPYPATRGMGLVAGAGPDADAARRAGAAAAGGGLVYGGGFVPDEPGWRAAAGGWWYQLAGVLPQHLARLEPAPRIVRWQKVQGVQADHWWRVPVLVSPDTGAASADQDALYVSALDRVWRGGQEWEDPADLAALQRRLIAIAHGIGLSGDPLKDHEQTAELVADLLRLGHHVSRDEIIGEGWLTLGMELRVLIAATETPLPEDATA